MLKTFLNALLRYGKNGLAAIGGAEIACYVLCGALVFCFFIGALSLRVKRLPAPSCDLALVMQKNQGTLRFFRTAAAGIALLLLCVVGLDGAYLFSVFTTQMEAAALFALYGICFSVLYGAMLLLVHAANGRMRLGYKVARLAEERRLASLRDTRLFSEIKQLKRALTEGQTASAFPVEGQPSAVSSTEGKPSAFFCAEERCAPTSNPANSTPLATPTPTRVSPPRVTPTPPVPEEPYHLPPQTEPFAPTPQTEPPKREGEKPTVGQGAEEKEKPPIGQGVGKKELPASFMQKPESSAPCGISRAKIGELLTRLSALPLSEGDALAAKKIELSLREALRFGGSPQTVSSLLAALLKILARYEAA